MKRFTRFGRWLFNTNWPLGPLAPHVLRLALGWPGMYQVLPCDICASSHPIRADKDDSTTCPRTARHRHTTPYGEGWTARAT